MLEKSLEVTVSVKLNWLTLSIIKRSGWSETQPRRIGATLLVASPENRDHDVTVGGR